MTASVIAFIIALGFWAWIVLGLSLIALEALAPGLFLIWFGLAALATGIVDAGFGLSWQGSALIFALMALLAVLTGRRLMREPVQGTRLNRRAENLVDHVFTLDAPIVNGQGRIRVEDIVWRIAGSDTEAGARVKVLRIDGNTLVVAPL